MTALASDSHDPIRTCVLEEDIQMNQTKQLKIINYVAILSIILLSGAL